MILRTVSFCAAPALFALAACGQDSVRLPDDAAGTVRAVVEHLAESRPDVLWEALPPSYQDDVHALVHEFAEKVDAKTYDKVFALLQQAVVVLDTKRDFFLGSKMVAGKVDVAEAKRKWGALVEMFDTIASSELSTVASLKTLDVGVMLRGTGRQFMAQLVHAAEMAKRDPFAEFSGFAVEEVEADGDDATIEISADHKSPEKMHFTRVEGRWVPSEMADEWDDAMDRVHQAIAAMPTDKDAQQQMKIKMALSMAEGFLDQLADVESQEEFDEAFAMLFGGLTGSMARPSRGR
jgi:hypothetical protein